MPEITLRDDWGMKPFVRRALKFPLRTLYIHHSVTPMEWDGTHSAQRIDEIHHYQNKNGFAYSYGLAANGEIMEGKGDFRGAHTKDHNSFSLAIVFFGDFEPREPVDGLWIGLDTPTPAAIESYYWLVSDLRKRERLTVDCDILPHNSAVPTTQCPGSTIVNLMDYWNAPAITLPPFRLDTTLLPTAMFHSSTSDLIIGQFGVDYDRLLGGVNEFKDLGVPLIQLEGQNWDDMVARMIYRESEGQF